MKKPLKTTYFGSLKEGFLSLKQGLKLSFRHFKDARQSHKAEVSVQDRGYFDQKGIVTLQYPFEEIAVPDIGRYKLHNEMDDCIVCDKCAKICPVDCIDIEPIKATGVVGHASDGSPIRLYAAKFDIDMAKCCFCGLCTTVCPTECLTMSKEHDFATYEVKDLNFAFGNLSPAQAEEKRALYEQFMAEKKAFVADKEIKKVVEVSEEIPVKKPAFIPKFKAVPKPEIVEEIEPVAEEIPVKKPAFIPKFKAVPKPEIVEEIQPVVEEIPVKKPAFIPKFKAVPKPEIVEEIEPVVEEIPVKKPAFVPKFRSNK